MLTEEEFYANPLLMRQAMRGMAMMADDPLIVEITTLYNRVSAYPQGILWLEKHKDECDLPDGDMFNRRYQKKVIRVFRKHLQKRRILLRCILSELEGKG